ncbi:LysR family transcriptional regulator [Arthrobacter sp. H14-L1]|uniref:LysR family transcriptional regulator n=1 Tax=Arthrobacter sp. H14-L1 TaxID=2996697 RepID=UPI00227206A6|nr:LysR family transcriptional regulator [Arthrobacter sp. H14-L1]MCY0906385.1 LysR family transcriptional regulator [Arthrobacter sp. H14-L1]
MNLRRLELFVAVAEELHFNRAAQRLHMAQPPLSQQIRKLEEECKVALFVRNSRNVELTAEGEVLLEHARKVLAQYAVMTAALTHARDGELGRLRLGFVSSAAIYLVPGLVRDMRAWWPGIDLQLREETTDMQLELIAAGSLDAGIAREMKTVAGISATVLMHEPLVVAVASDHRLATRSSVALKDLKGEAFIAFPRSRISSLFDHISALLHAVGVDFDIAQEAVQFPTILGLVSAHLGIAVVPESMRAFAIPGLVYLDIEDTNATSTVSLIYSTEASNPMLVSKIRSAVRESSSVKHARHHGTIEPTKRAAVTDPGIRPGAP